MQSKKTIIVFCCLAMLAACVNTQHRQQRDRTIQRDSGPDQPVDVSHVPDAEPRWEPRTAAGNKSPYTVLGSTYRVMASADNYSERGIASWYGRKFHGARTSNGEVYNMYGMTAAHKTLPIPTFVRVTNLDNGKQVIVRVNDRGPFHDGRIIDLSYAAARKLGFESRGTANVEVEAINPPEPDTFLQAGAFGSQESASALQKKLVELTSLPVFIAADAVKPLFRVRIGPIADNVELLDLRERIRQLNLGMPHIVRE